MEHNSGSFWHQVHALVAEFVEPPVEIVAEERNMDGKSVGVISIPGPPCWKVYIDGAAN